MLWPNKELQKNVSFKNGNTARTIISTKDSNISGLVSGIREFQRGLRIPVVDIEGIPSGLDGVWGLFGFKVDNGFAEIKDPLLNLDIQNVVYFPLFLSSEGDLFKPTANRIWDRLQFSNCRVSGYEDAVESSALFDTIVKEAKDQALELLEGIRSEQTSTLNRELQRLSSYNLYQQDQTERTGLENIKDYRQRQLALYNDRIDEECRAYRMLKPKVICYQLLSLRGE